MTIEEINHEIEQLEPAEINTRNVQVLSSLYIIRNNFSKSTVSEIYIFPDIKGTELNESISGKSVSDVLDILNEHMEVIQVLYPTFNIDSALPKPYLSIRFLAIVHLSVIRLGSVA